MLPTYPFLTAGEGDYSGIRRDGLVTAGSLLNAAARLAETLPERRFAINACSDRLNFMAGLAAAMERSQITLLPHVKAPEAIRNLAADYPGVYVITDGDLPEWCLESVTVPLFEKRAASSRRFVFPADQIAVTAFTSGSTGKPAAHVKTWGSLCVGAELAARRFRVDGVNVKSIVATVPPQHMYGLETTIMLPIQTGIPVFAGRPFFPQDIASAIALCPKPAMVISAPVHIRACLLEKTGLEGASFLISATAPLSKNTARETESTFGLKVMEIYGCTEAGSIASRNTSEADDWTPYDGVVFYEDNGVFQVDGGHLEQRTPLNDTIELSPDGARFKLAGRNAELVNIGGKRVMLSELNHILNSIEGVEDGVFFVNEPEGENEPRLAAFAVATKLKAKDIIEKLRQNTDPVFLPRPLYLVDSIPRNDTGKISREALLDYAKKLAGREVTE